MLALKLGLKTLVLGVVVVVVVVMLDAGLKSPVRLLLGRSKDAWLMSCDWFLLGRYKSEMGGKGNASVLLAKIHPIRSRMHAS